MPNNVKSISKGAFYGCNELAKITLPFIGANRDSIGSNASFGYIFGYDTTYVSDTREEGTNNYRYVEVSSSNGKTSTNTDRRDEIPFGKMLTPYAYDMSDNKFTDNILKYYEQMYSTDFVPIQLSISPTKLDTLGGVWQL